MIDFNQWAKTVKAVAINLPTVQIETRERLMLIADFLSSLAEPPKPILIVEKKEQKHEGIQLTGKPPEVIYRLEEECDD